MITGERLEKLPRSLCVTFAADCAEHVLPIFERGYPDDPRPRLAIVAVRDLLRGAASAEWAARAHHGALRACFEPRGPHSITGIPGWLSGLAAIDATTAAHAATAAAAAAGASGAHDAARFAVQAADEAAMAVAWAAVADDPAAVVDASPAERAWQEERLADLEARASA
jgi:hypothetical protein